MIKIKYESLKDFDEFDLSGLKKMSKECIKGATLLSKEDAENLDKEERTCERAGTPCSWWLHTPSCYPSGTYCVRRDGTIDYESVDIPFEVRPTLIINLELSKLKEDELFKFGGYMFKIISKNLALCEEAIGECVFRKNWRVKDANDYEKSDIKKYVDNWFEKAYREYEE